METGSDRNASQQGSQQQDPDAPAAGSQTQQQQFVHNLRQVAMHPSPDPIDTVTTGLFYWSARQ